MIWLTALRRSGGVDALARRLNSNPPTIAAGVTVIMPTLLRAIRAFIGDAGGGEAGFAALIAVLDDLGDGELAANVMGPGPLRLDAGTALLAQLCPAGVDFAEAAAQADDLDREFLERLATPLAMLVGGYIAAKALGGDRAAIRSLLSPSPNDERIDTATRGSGE